MCAFKRKIEWCNSHSASYYSSLANRLYVKRVRLELTSRTCVYAFSVSFLVKNAKTTKQWHVKCGINLLPDWPGNFPECNPIENLSSEAKTCMRHERPTSIEGIKKIISRVWAGIDQSYLTKLYKSMPRCMQAVIAAEGGHT